MVICQICKCVQRSKTYKKRSYKTNDIGFYSSEDSEPLSLIGVFTVRLEQTKTHLVYGDRVDEHAYLSLCWAQCPNSWIFHASYEEGFCTLQVFLAKANFHQKPPWCSGKATRLVNQWSWVLSRASLVFQIRL